MTASSIKIGFRKFIKKPAFSIINALGLAIGLACFVLTMVYVNYELSYDNFHKNKGRIHLVTVTINFADYFIENQTSTTAMLAEELKENFPEVQTATQVGGSYNTVIHHGEKVFRQTGIYAADSSFFNVFTYDFIYGSPENALNNPGDLVITESTAKKYFGTTNAYGEVLKMYDGDMKISGIIKDTPENSVIGFDMVASIYTFDERYRSDPHWQNNNFTTYLVLNEGIDPMQLEEKFPTLIKSKIPRIKGQAIDDWMAAGNRWEYHLFELKDIHLKLRGNGIYVMGFSIVAVFLLIIACINYMNLSTAKASKRAKEVGVRKAVGAFHGNLLRLFLGESMMMSFLSLILAMGIVELVLPYLSEFIGKKLEIHYFDNVLVLPGLIFLGIIIGFLSGTYPAFVMSSFKPVTVLKGEKVSNTKGLTLRNILVFVQFTISIFLIISLIVIYKQTDLLYTKKLGYDKDNLLVVQNIQPLRLKKDIFKADLYKIPSVESATFISRMFNKSSGPSNQWTPQGRETTLLAVMSGDPDFVKTLDIKMHAGRFFDSNIATDSSAAIINQAATRLLNWGDTLYKTLDNGRDKVKVIGIMKDFHFQTLQSEIMPLMVLYDGARYSARYLSVRFKPGEMKSTIKRVEELWNEYVPDAPFEYYVYSEKYKTYYNTEGQTSRLMLILTILVLVVTSMGLYGLAVYIAEERMKEVAIRKAIGASVFSIVAKMSWSFTKLVLLANVLAWPFAWYFMNDWLNNFASRISISWWIFIAAAFVSYIFAILTIISQAFMAANRNPVDVLRYE